MSVFSALEESESEQGVSAERVLGQHTLNSQFHRLGGLGSHEGVVTCFFEMTDVTGVALPLLLSELAAGEHRVLAVDDDHVVAAVYVGSKGGLVLASEEHSSLSGNSAEGLAGCVDNIPSALNFGGFS